MPLIIITLCLCLAVAAVFTVLSFKKTLLNLYLKSASSVLFTVLGVFCLYYLVSRKSGEIADNGLIGGFLLLLGLVFSLIGDVILGLPRLTELRRDSLPVLIGGASYFGLAHVIYCISLIFLFGINLWVIPIIIPLSVFYVFGNKLFGKLDYKNLTVGLIAYSLIEALSFALCFTSLLQEYSAQKLLLTVGFTLFYFSDMVLMHNYFGERKRVISILCHSTYYPAQILIALSIYFIA
ncbi:MAG: lysoplasmalogenase family protein [Candidatus Borkfalkiaceae bacterium]|nr:lysoplasmalogenase family protein [Christensenellaceae bacterium]